MKSEVKMKMKKEKLSEIVGGNACKAVIVFRALNNRGIDAPGEDIVQALCQNQ